MILHTINKSSSDNEIFFQCMENLQDGDCIILFGDAINIAKKENNYLGKKTEKLNVKFYALREHVERISHNEAFCPELTIIEYEDFLDLSIQCSTSQSWY